MRINGAEWIVQEINVGVLVKRTGKLDPLFLATTQVHSSLPYFGQITIRKQLEVLHERTSLKRFSVSLAVHWGAKQNVVLDCACLNPCRLRNIGNPSIYLNLQNSISSILVINLFNLSFSVRIIVLGN